MSSYKDIDDKVVTDTCAFPFSLIIKLSHIFDNFNNFFTQNEIIAIIKFPTIWLPSMFSNSRFFGLSLASFKMSNTINFINGFSVMLKTTSSQSWLHIANLRHFWDTHSHLASTYFQIQIIFLWQNWVKISTRQKF